MDHLHSSNHPCPVTIINVATQVRIEVLDGQWSILNVGLSPMFELKLNK